MIQYTDQQIADEAIRLGLIKPGEKLPTAMRSRVVAGLVTGARSGRPQPDAEPQVAQQITITPGAGVMVDGEPFPWIVQAETFEVTVAPDGSGLVRLTIPTKSVQINQRESEKR